jgi:hypothetical protein
MAKKPTPLTFRDIVLGADADVIRQALEARVKIDQLIAERQAAYERIAALETQIETVVGEPGVYPFPQPPQPVAGFDPKAETVNRGAPAKKPARSAADDAADSDEGDTAPAQA